MRYPLAYPLTCKAISNKQKLLPKLPLMCYDNIKSHSLTLVSLRNQNSAKNKAEFCDKHYSESTNAELLMPTIHEQC